MGVPTFARQRLADDRSQGAERQLRVRVSTAARARVRPSANVGQPEASIATSAGTASLALEQLGARRGDVRRGRRCGCTSTGRSCSVGRGDRGHRDLGRARLESAEHALGAYFEGLIDEVRVCTPSAERRRELAGRHGTVARRQTSAIDDPSRPSPPAAGPSGLAIDTFLSATFSEAMNPATIDASTFEVTDGTGGAGTGSSRVRPSDSPRDLHARQRARVCEQLHSSRPRRPGGVKDMAGRSLAADLTWTFGIEVVPPPVAVLTAKANPYTEYLDEVVRTEGLSFASFDVSLISATVLSYFDTVVLGETGPDAGASDDPDELGDCRRQPDRDATRRTARRPPGPQRFGHDPRERLPEDGLLCASRLPGVNGAVDPVPRHGRPLHAERCDERSRRSTPTLRRRRRAPPSRSVIVGVNGGQAAAFTYDLARSIVYTRQGNPSWVGQERDGVAGIRPDDLVFGAKVGDVQPDWLDINKIGIPPGG